MEKWNGLKQSKLNKNMYVQPHKMFFKVCLSHEIPGSTFTEDNYSQEQETT